MDELDMIIQQMDDILRNQEYMKEQLSAIASKIDKQGAIISAIEEKIKLVIV
jgi:hypothetical protein